MRGEREINRRTGPPVAEIELRHNYNGSGPQAFGGASKWPVVTLHLALCEGQEGLADIWASHLAEFFNKHRVKARVKRYENS